MDSAAILGFGYLGRPLAEQLYLNGWDVLALKRTLTSDDINLPIALQQADVNDIERYREIFDQNWACKAVWISLLPPSPLSDYDACLKTWAALAKEYGVKHIIYCSSISVYGSRARICDENSMPEPETENARKILAAEQALLGSGIENIDILRLGGLYSGSRHPLYTLLQRQTAIKNAGQPVNMLHQNLAVTALFRAASDTGGIRIRNIVESEHPAKQKFYNEQARSLGLPIPEFETGSNEGKIVQSLYRDIMPVVEMPV